MPFRARHDVAVDAGTGYLRAFGTEYGLFVEEPAVDPARDAAPPLDGGVVVDPERAARRFEDLLWRVRAGTRPRVLASVPSDATDAEKQRLREALKRAGAGRLTLVLEPLSGALGAGLDLSSPFTQMIVDVGEGVTDVAVLREGRIELTAAVRTGVAALRASVRDHFVQSEGVDLSSWDTQRLLERVDPHGSSDLGQALLPALDRITAPIREAWSRLSEPASCEVIEDGICLTGGGAELACVRKRIAAVTRLDVHLAERPRHAVIRGNSLMAVERYGPGR
jgi:rod shape-determining protein MreB